MGGGAMSGGVRVFSKEGTKMKMRLWGLVLLLALTPLMARAEGEKASAPAADPRRVPFVGCEADGQAGPLNAPQAARDELPLADAGGKLAYYQAQKGPGVLGPRGWKCYGWYGSNGAFVVVGPELEVLKTLGGPFGSPRIVAQAVDGDTSGKYEIAGAVARVFPKYKSFVDKIVADDNIPAAYYVFEPYPADSLHYLSDEAVEFETPAHSEGLASDAEDAYPTSGFVMLRTEKAEEDSAPQIEGMDRLDIQLPPKLQALSGKIREQFEQKYTPLP